MRVTMEDVWRNEVIDITSSDDEAVPKWSAARWHPEKRRADAAAAARQRADAKRHAKAKRHVEAKRRAEVAAAARQRAVKITRRGPNIKGRDTYDPYCVFANKVVLEPTQVKKLKQVAKEKPKIPLYVCTIKEANIQEGKAKMYFSRKYTNAYIKKHVDLNDWRREKLRVWSGGGELERSRW